MSNKKQHGIIFTTEMVNAILDGRKTQTRRVIKPQPKDGADFFGWLLPDYEKIAFGFDAVDSYHRNKYGKVGDLLYVKEAWTHSTHPLHKFMYKAHAERHSGLVVKWEPPRFMPKEAARIWLEITDIRVERLHDISANDIKAEGIIPSSFHFIDLYEQWQNLWIKIKGQKSWDANPWVWVISFKCIDKSDRQ